MPVKKLKQFLNEKKVKYVNIKHSPAYTAHEIAQSAHIPGKDLAKTVIVKSGDQLSMVIMSANNKINFPTLANQIGVSDLELATERDFQDKFPGCEIGAMPPFGNLYDMDVYVDENLTKDDEIAFNAGSHSELIKLAYKDFNNLVHPKMLHAA